MKDEEKRIILSVISTINGYINPNAYYSGADVQDLLLDAEEELLKDLENK